MKALVTGGGGFLGGAIATKLVARGDEVRSFSRGPHAELESLGVEHIRGDLADSEAVSRAVRDSDVVFHVGAKAGVWDVSDLLRFSPFGPAISQSAYRPLVKWRARQDSNLQPPA